MDPVSHPAATRKLDTILVTGGAGFIGSALVRFLIESTAVRVINLDKLTYAGNLQSLKPVAGHERYRFELGDVCDAERVGAILEHYKPDAVVHLAAESHVDRSIDDPSDFIQTNVVGTYTLLNAARHYWDTVHARNPSAFIFHQISTDEVFGSLPDSGLFTEDSPVRPNSPYSASKAAADHLARAWHKTYGLPVLITNCSNNYGPYQFPEKLIPLTIINALAGRRLPIYGAGSNVRDWLYVDDHVRALWRVLCSAQAGATYTIGGRAEQRNIDVVTMICALLDELLPASPYVPHISLKQHIEDRPGHDQRYAIDSGKLEHDMGWLAVEDFASGLRKTVAWYLANEAWWRSVMDGSYQGERLGLASGKPAP